MIKLTLMEFTTYRHALPRTSSKNVDMYHAYLLGVEHGAKAAPEDIQRESHPQCFKEPASNPIWCTCIDGIGEGQCPDCGLEKTPF